MYGSRRYHGRGKPVLPGILMFVLFVFIISKAWWLLFFLPLFFGFIFKSNGGCWMPFDHDDSDPGKRKNDDLFYPDDKPKNEPSGRRYVQTDSGDWVEIV